jgi:hypothetical protein
MKRLKPRSALLLSAIVAASIGGGMANASAHTQTVSVAVADQRSISTSQAAVNFTNVPKSATDFATGGGGGNLTYSTDAACDKVTATLNEAFTDVTLKLTTGTPGTGTGTNLGTATSAVTVSTSAADVITAVDGAPTPVAGAVSTLTYTVTTANAAVGSQSKTVTFELVTGTGCTA